MLTPSCKAIIVATGLCLASFAPAASAQEWTRFHGPNGQGVSDTKGLPTTWSEKDYNWRIDLPGPSHSSPVLWGTKLFVTAATGNNWSMMCIDSESGKTLWKKDYPQEPYKTNKLNSYASATPACDEKQVYAPTSSDKDYFLIAWDHDGNEKWRYRVGSYISQHGTASSPVVYNDLVILVNDQDGPDEDVNAKGKGGGGKAGESFIVAVDKNTGAEKWKLKRNTVLTSYANPAVYQPKGGKPMLIFASKAHGLFAVDPATGKQLWDSPKLYALRPIMSPTIDGDVVITSCGSGGGKSNYVVACKITPSGPKELWKLTKQAPYVPTPVVHKGTVYLVNDGGFLIALDTKTGKEKFQARIEGKSGGSSASFFGSPILAGDQIYVMSRQGDAYVFKAGDKYEVLGVVPLGDESHSTPAVANGHLFLRTFNHLYSVGGKQSL
jgi:outer membrane protein assembly factor BamB